MLRDGKLVGVFDTAGMTPSRLTELMTGKTFDSRVVARDRIAAKPVLQVQGLTRRGEFEDMSRSPCAKARCSASPASSAPAAPSSRTRSSA